MLFDYIYLLASLCVISLILFLIYLSYEYRIEGFTLQYVNDVPNNNPNTIINLKTSLLNSYKKYYNDTMNQEIYQQNTKNLDIYNKTLVNLNNSKNLVDLNLGLIPKKSIFPSNIPIKTIKSKYNSQYLSTFQNDIKNDINKYGIIANDKCLTVKGLCNDEFCLIDCQNKLYISDSQKFTTDRIYSGLDAARIMNVDYSYIDTNNTYPFNIFRSAVTNKCLTISDKGISVDKCNLNNKKQQWEISPNENICYLS